MPPGMNCFYFFRSILKSPRAIEGTQHRTNQLCSKGVSPDTNMAPGKRALSILSKENALEATQPFHLGSHRDTPL